MQLIKDFSDIQKIVGLLGPDNQEKLLNEINSLLVKYINEQNKPQTNNISTEQNNPLENYINEQNKPVINNIVPENKSFVPFSDFQAGSISGNPPPPPPPMETSAGLNALKSSFAKNANLPSPPPPLPQLPPQPNPVVRNIGSGAFNLKSSFGNKPPGNKTATLNVMDCLGYIVPVLTDLGKESLKNPATPSDMYQFFKQTDGESSLKQIYMFLYPTMAWGKYLEKIYPLSKERYLNFRKSNNFPADTEILIRVGDLLVSLGIISEANLEKALQSQKEGPKPSVANNVEVPGWIEKTKAMIPQETGPGQPVKKRLIGDTLIDLGMITKDQLNHVLSIQRWLKNLIEHF